MSPSSTPGRRLQPHWPTATLTVLVCGILCGAAVLAMPALHPGRQAVAPAPPACPVAEMQAPAHDAPPSSALDALRVAAALGNEDASAALSGVLLARYEQLADPAALFESIEWLARDVDSPRFQAFALIDRVVHGPCVREPALRWHWLCNLGE